MAALGRAGLLTVATLSIVAGTHAACSSSYSKLEDADGGADASADGGANASVDGGAKAGVDGGANGSADGGGPNHCAEFSIDASAPQIGASGGPPCNGDNGSTASAACPTHTQPFCNGVGACTICGDCTAAPGHPGAVCSPTWNECGTDCSDAGCGAGRYCDSVTGPPITKAVCAQKGTSGDIFKLFFYQSMTCAEVGAFACASGAAATLSGDTCMCGKANGEACAGDGECASRTCPDGRCGAPLGAACQTASQQICRSGACDPRSCACAATCAKDSDCGSALGGKVCSADMGACVAGCRGSGGNGCPYGSTCSSVDTTIGKCTVDGG